MLYDNKTSPTGMAVTVPTILTPGASTTITFDYPIVKELVPFFINGQLDTVSVTNSAYATAIGNGINVVSNQVILPIYYHYIPYDCLT